MPEQVTSTIRSYPVFLFFWIAVPLIAILPGCTANKSADNEITEEYNGFLQIPGVGWQTFFRTAQTDPTLIGLPFKSGCAYMRWTWGDLEPEEGRYAFAMIDEWLEKCREANQALAFRVMLSWPGYDNTIPQWLIDKGIRYTYSECPEEGAHYEVDIEEPLVSQLHAKLIRALGERYDGHPDLALVENEPGLSVKRAFHIEMPGRRNVNSAATWTSGDGYTGISRPGAKPVATEAIQI